MGSSSSRSASGINGTDSAVDAHARALDLQLLDQQIVDLFTFKILCLGAGESGKSTVVKQLKLIHKKATEKDELDLIAASLNQNVVDCMQAISSACRTFSLPAVSEEDSATEAMLLMHDGHSRLPLSMSRPITSLFNSSSYQAAYARRSEYWILDSFPYYMKHLERFLSDDFVPTEEDAVMARVRTTGIVESVLEQRVVKEEEDEPEFIAFRVVDVGGQRNERKKWMHCFSDVKAILFIVNLAGYNAVLFEDGNKNRLVEELELFEQVTNNPLFRDTPIFLFLNKKDLFESLIAEFPMSAKFPDYTGDDTLAPALSYIMASFNRRLPAGKQVHISVLSARWKRDVKAAFDDVKKALYDLNRKDLLGQAGKINKQRKELGKHVGTTGAQQASASKEAGGKKSTVAKSSGGESEGLLQRLANKWRACCSCWMRSKDHPRDLTTVHVERKKQDHNLACSASADM